MKTSWIRTPAPPRGTPWFPGRCIGSVLPVVILAPLGLKVLRDRMPDAPTRLRPPSW